MICVPFYFKMYIKGKTMKKLARLFLFFGLFIVVAGCKNSTDESAELVKIEITNQANKTEYAIGQDLDITGLEITATYDDETTKVVTGWTTSGFDNSKLGEQTITVTYTEAKVSVETSYKVTVKEFLLEKIEITTLPTKLEYYENDSLDLEGLVVTAVYSNGTTVDVTKNIKTSGFDSSVATESQTITVTYKEKSATFEIKINPVLLTGIEITAEPEKKEYHLGAALDLTGLNVIARYNNDKKVNVTTEITTSGFDSTAEAENQTITVTYKEKTTAFTISITWFHNEVTVLPAETDGTYGTEATYVEFGDWPQDVVPAADVTTLGLETSTTKVTRGYMEFVKGTDGNYYVKCAENAKIATSTYKDTTTVGQGGTTNRWFKVMPIKWRVYDQEYDVDGDDEGKNATAKLLVAENILTANVPYYDNRVCRTINAKSVYPSNYMHSQIRAYLNGINYQGESAEQTQWNNKGFLQTAFTEYTAEKIINTLVDNSAISTTNYDGYNISKATDLYCENTQDKIFLLSELEVTKYSKSGEKYNAAASSRVRKVTDFALANYAFQSAKVTDSCYWWLRSPKYSDSNYSRYIGEKGEANGASSIDTTWNGVVPALCIQY